MRRALVALLPILIAACSTSTAPEPPARPNIVLVITDDQGYGDVGVNGNSVIQTPNLDQLKSESVSLENYHVDPTCAPTRSALLSGRYSSRTGVWHTIAGRSLVHRDETLAGDIFSAAGYHTGMFGKWHLGDNYPYRPEDRGFDRVVRHGGGGVWQTPDYWGNDYFDDTYWRDGEPVAYEGYCTDVFFDEALAFIEESRDEPFFVYLATNAPHGPYWVDESYSKPYADQGVSSPMAEFYGMITNIDENIGRLRAKLDELGLAENTIFIFTTDNGTAAGVSGDGSPVAEGEWGGFNDGMRGRKGSEYEGGHRVPFFVRWPAGGVGGGRELDGLTAHVDILPTLAELTGTTLPEGLDLDGTSIAAPLLGEGEIPARTLTVHSQRIEFPEKWRKSAVMTPRWRLVNGEELYDIQADPGQQRDIAGDNPTVVADLRAEYDAWWEHISERFDSYVPIVIGADGENPARITAHDWHPFEQDNTEWVPWNQDAIKDDRLVNGVWRIDVAEAGRYRFRLLQWDEPAGKELDAVKARVKVGDAEATADVPAGATEVSLELDLEPGETTLETALTTAAGKERGAFFVYAERL